MTSIRNSRGYWIVGTERYKGEEVTLVMHEVYLGRDGEVHATHVTVLPWATDPYDEDMLYCDGKRWYVSLPYESIVASGYQKLITTSKSKMFVK